jgi:lathosterol oxidase
LLIASLTDMQLQVSTNAMVLYTWLPTWSEWLVERGFSLAYDKIGTVSPYQYILYFALYMLGVEFGIYWMHRLLHDIKPLYRLLHSVHHKYNKNNTLSPFGKMTWAFIVRCNRD